MKHIEIEKKQITRNGNIWQTFDYCLSDSINFIPKDTRDVYQMLKGISFGDVHNLKKSIEDLRFAFKIKFYPAGYEPYNEEQEYQDITEQVMPLLVEELINLFGPMNWRHKTKYARGHEYKKMTQKSIELLESMGIQVE